MNETKTLTSSESGDEHSSQTHHTDTTTADRRVIEADVAESKATITASCSIDAVPRPESSTASPSSAVQSNQDPPPPPLELGWTRLKRRRIINVDDDGAQSGNAADTQTVEETTNTNHAKNEEKGDGDNEDDDDDDWLTSWCCEDPSCRRRSTQQPRSRQGTTLLRGQVVWFLPESTDSPWFQGYLFPSSSNTTTTTFSLKSSTTHKAWGLLAQTVEIDECLTCAAGGFRRLEVTAYQPKDTSVPTSLLSSKKSRNNHALGQVDWTGGDMMRLQGPQMRMQPHQILTHEKAVPYVRGIFASLWKRLRDEAEQEEGVVTDPARSLGVLDVVPDVSIVLGDLEISLPPGDTRSALHSTDDL